MKKVERIQEFERLVNKKYKIYNSLFLNLPYRQVKNIGNLVPILHQECQEGLEAGNNPKDILAAFFNRHAKIESEAEQISFMFSIIQYVERQVVLYDSIEDSAFDRINALGDYISVENIWEGHKRSEQRDAVLAKLSSFSSRIVFTAHPTQFYPPSVLDIIGALRDYIPANNVDAIDLTLQQLGLTSLLNSKKPTPYDEAKNIIYFLRNIYYNAIGNLYSQIKRTVDTEDFQNYDLIKLGFWPGGDRDGNPFVTAEITKSVADELRMTLMKCYYSDVKKLKKLLSFRDIEDSLDTLNEDLYAAMFDSEKLINIEEVLAQLGVVRKTLIEKYHALYLDQLDLFIDKVNIFKSHFATLDIRQDHSKHYSLVEQILVHNGKLKSSLEEVSDADLLAILADKSITLDGFKTDDATAQDTLDNIRQLAHIQTMNGQDGCNRYIISNSEDIFSVLFVQSLFKWCGWDEITFDIVPLFETMKGMSESSTIMRTLLDDPVYRQHVTQRGNSQTMMLGFSDGTKDGGYLKANWSIFKTKEVLSKACSDYGIEAIFFDGRGGPPARGGGKTHKFYASQTKDIANNEIQLTIQGQTITSTYGTEEQFAHNVEQLISAGLRNEFGTDNGSVDKHSRALIEEVAELSFAKYQALKEHDKFIPYLEQKSTLKYYAKANIGSRPSKRGNKAQLTLSDLRAISFVGSWSQLKQNVPGYFGIGTAFKALKDQGRIEELINLYQSFPFFKALISNSMMSLSKTNFQLTKYMSEDKEFSEFWNILKDEYELTKAMILEVSKASELMEEEPISRASVGIRNDIVLPLLVIQQAALQKISEGSEHKTAYEKIVTRSLYGNINASRNSA